MMTEALDVVRATTPPRKKPLTLSARDVEPHAFRALVQAAQDRGEDLTGPDRLLRQLSLTVLETALDEEMREHLGYAESPVVETVSSRHARLVRSASTNGPRRDHEVEA